MFPKLTFVFVNFDLHHTKASRQAEKVVFLALYIELAICCGIALENAR
jgi:hypothetical protein